MCQCQRFPLKEKGGEGQEKAFLLQPIKLKYIFLRNLLSESATISASNWKVIGDGEAGRRNFIKLLLWLISGT